MDKIVTAIGLIVATMTLTVIVITTLCLIGALLKYFGIKLLEKINKKRYKKI